MEASIHHLQTTFSTATKNKDCYVNYNATTGWTQTREKQHLPLFEVFTKATQFIQQLNISNYSLIELSQEINDLQQLKSDANTLYIKRYCAFPKALKRSLLKIFETCFPKAFCYQINKIENLTEQAYRSYQTAIEQQVKLIQYKKDYLTQYEELKNLAHQISTCQVPPSIEILKQYQIQLAKIQLKFREEKDFSVPRLSVNHLVLSNLDRETICFLLPFIDNIDHLDLSQTAIKESDLNEFKAKGFLSRVKSLNISHCQDVKELFVNQQLVKEAIERLKDHLSLLKAHHPPRVFLLTRWISLVKECLIDVQALSHSLISSPEMILKDLESDSQIVSLLLQPKDWEQNLIKKDQQALQKIFNFTAWGETLKQTLKAQPFEIKIKIMANEAQIFNADRLRLYKGIIKVEVSNLQLLTTFIQKQTECRPCTLEINFNPQESLTLENIQDILTLNKLVPEIILNGLSHIQVEGLEFCTVLPRLICPHLQTLTLSNQPLDPNQCTTLLKFFPSLDLMRQCYQICSDPTKIILPPRIITQNDLDLSHYSVENLSCLINQFAGIKKLNLSHTAVTDEWIKTWLEQGLFKNLHTLRLDNCSQLTLKVMNSLVNISSLWQLYLPLNLKIPETAEQQQKILKQLPALDNPFKVFLFYGQPIPLLQSLANDRYQGPSVWSSVFQIPLARMNTQNIFPPHHHTLDPKSLAYWLHESDYQYLSSEHAVKTILADYSTELTDDNLVELIKKFPNLNHLSLYHCCSPKLTARGIQTLMDYLGKHETKIQTLDLTGCPQVTNNIILENLQVLKRLNQLILSETSLSPDVIEIAKECLQHRLVYEDKILRLTNDQLVHEESLEEILSFMHLNQLTQINLEGCTNLTDNALAKLLNRLSFPDPFDPQKLNIAELNLRGCSQITYEVFQNGVDKNGCFIPKPSGNLDRLIISGTQITPQALSKLKIAYPNLLFLEEEKTRGTPIDINTQLQECQLYYTLLEEGREKDQSSSTNLLPLTSSLIQNRIALQLFAFKAENLNALNSINEIFIDPLDSNYCDRTLYFDVYQTNGQSCSHQVHQEVLYSQSKSFREALRPGGYLFKQDFILQNQHTTPQACQSLIDLIYGKETYKNLDWISVSHLAELVKKEYFDLPEYDSSIRHIVNQYLDHANEILLLAKSTHNIQDIEEYKKILILLSTSSQNQDRIRQLAYVHQLDI